MKINIKITLTFVLIILLLSGAIILTVSFETILNYILEDIIYFSVIYGSVIILSVFLVIFLSLNISRPIKKINKTIKILNREETENLKSILPERSDEIGMLSESIRDLHKTIRFTYNFAYTLVKGKYNLEFKLDDDNLLGNTLLELKEKLLLSEKEKKYVLEENRKTEWYQKGVSDFTKLFQKNFELTVDMTDSAVKTLIKHLEVEQGGIFILEKEADKEILVLETAYAYDKKKLLNTEIEVGESLVGKCAKDKEIIQIDDLPEGYTFIGSGLGEDTPQTLILLPLLYENNLYGVIEIASLIKIPEYKIKFLQVIGERIASEISNIQSKLLSKKLADDFKKQAEEITEKEKESSETISDLLKKQEDMLYREKFQNKISDAFNTVTSCVIFDNKGKVTDFNEKAKEHYIFEDSELDNINYFEQQKDKKEDKEISKRLLEELSEGKKVSKSFVIQKEKIKKNINQTFIPILDSDNILSEIICVGTETDD